MVIGKKFINNLIIFSLCISLFACKNKSVAETDLVDGTDSTTQVQNDTAVAINYDNVDASQKIVLRFQPDIGKTYFVVNNSNYTSFQSMDTLEMKATSTKFGKVKLQVQGIENDNYKIIFTLIDASKTIKDDSSTIDYKYGKALLDPIADVDRQIEDCMVNTPLTIFLNQNGEGTNILGYEEIIRKIKAIVGSDVPDAYIANSIGTPTDNLENYFVYFPDTAVSIGESWDITTNSSLQGLPIILTNTYTLADRKDGISYINFNTKVTIDKSQLPADVIAEMANLKFKAYIKGTSEVEERTGWPKVVKITQKMELKDTFEGHTTVSIQTNSGVIRWVD